MIKRAPRPDNGFLIVRNEVVRDRRLSFVGRGVLLTILSRPDNWSISAERLATETDADEGVKTVRRALRELEAAGYLERRRVRGPKGRFTWDQIIYDTPRKTATSPNDVSAGRTISPSPPDGYPPDGEGTSKEEPRRSTDQEDVTEVECTTSSRFAPSGGGDSKADDLLDDPWTAAGADVGKKPRTDWRTQDRDTFRDLLGEEVMSSGVNGWRQGKFPTNAIYDALRSKGKKPMRWPGQYLSKLSDESPTGGLENWLDEQGFELV